MRHAKMLSVSQMERTDNTIERMNEIWRGVAVPETTGIFTDKEIVKELRERKKANENWEKFFASILPVIDNNKTWANRKILPPIKTYACVICKRVCNKDEMQKFRRYDNDNGSGMKWTPEPICKKCAGDKHDNDNR
jgi:hypothetical protein